MREVDFLPAWYPLVRRRRAMAVTQAWATAVLMGTFCLFGVAEHQRVMAYESSGGQLYRDMVKTRSELKTLDEQLKLKMQLEQQGLILSKVGLPVDITRLLGEIDQLMSPQMFLIELAVDTEETLKTAPPPAANNKKSTSPAKSANAEADKWCDRKLKIKVVCVAPSDVDVANFLAGLTNKPYLDQVAMTYAKDRVQNHRLMREFELTFLINLNTPSVE